MKKVFDWLLKNKYQLLFFLFIAALFFINTLHESYPDEFDNIMGGWYILHGRLIYTGFFTHHGPVPYFLAGILEIFSGRSFVHFRLVYAASLLAYFFGVRHILKNKISDLSNMLFTALIIVFGFGATYYWTHMLLADNIAALTFLPVFVLISDKLYRKMQLSFSDMWLISILLAVGFYASLAYIYVLMLVVAVVLGSYYVSSWHNLKTLKSWIMPLIIFAVPHLVFFIYLILTGSVRDYYNDAWVFNEKYYIFNYPRPEGASINPIRYAVIIGNNFINNFLQLLIGVKNFDFATPMNMVLAVGNVALLLYLLVSRRFVLSLFVILSLIYATPRSNPLLSQETDYQMAVYILFSYWNILFVLGHLYKDLRDGVDGAQRIIFGFLLILTGIYGVFGGLFLFKIFEEKTYNKYMGISPLIYDRPERAPIINAVVSNNDYMWIGPFAFEDLFYANGQLPSKYQILIPGMAHAPGIPQAIQSDFEKHPPVIAMYDKNFNILGSVVGQYAPWMTDLFSKNYITLLSYKDGDKVYRSVAPISVGHVDVETQLYIRKDKVSEFIPKLVAAGYIKEERVK